MIEDLSKPFGMGEKVTLADIKDMIRQIRDDVPEAGDIRAVLSDWCEIMGFVDAAHGLRMPLISLECNRALTALRMLFGDSGGGVQKGSYSAVLGLPVTAIAPGDVVTIETQAELVMRVRRFYISDTINQYFRVENVRVGKYLLLASADPVPADLFGPLMPDLMDHTAQVSERISLTINNCSDVDIVFSGCVLGIDFEQYMKNRPRVEPDWPVRVGPGSYQSFVGGAGGAGGSGVGAAAAMNTLTAGVPGASGLPPVERCRVCNAYTSTAYCSTACFNVARSAL